MYKGPTPRDPNAQLLNPYGENDRNFDLAEYRR